MRTVETKEEYNAVCKRIEELLKIVGNETLSDDVNFIELNLLSDLAVDYEETNEPISSPMLTDVLKLRMYERGLNQKCLSELLGVSASRVSEYLTGKNEPPLKVARTICTKLDIDPGIVLGV